MQIPGNKLLPKHERQPPVNATHASRNRSQGGGQRENIDQCRTVWVIVFLPITHAMPFFVLREEKRLLLEISTEMPHLCSVIASPHRMDCLKHQGTPFNAARLAAPERRSVGRARTAVQVSIQLLALLHARGAEGHPLVGSHPIRIEGTDPKIFPAKGLKIPVIANRSQFHRV